MGDIAKAAREWCETMKQFRQNHDNPKLFSEATTALNKLISSELVPKDKWDEADITAMELLKEMQARIDID